VAGVVSERLRMGDESRVMHAIRREQVPPGPELAGLKEHLERACLRGRRHPADTRAPSVFGVPGLTPPLRLHG